MQVNPISEHRRMSAFSQRAMIAIGQCLNELEMLSMLGASGGNRAQTLSRRLEKLMYINSRINRLAAFHQERALTRFNNLM